MLAGIQYIQRETGRDRNGESQMFKEISAINALGNRLNILDT